MVINFCSFLKKVESIKTYYTSHNSYYLFILCLLTSDNFEHYYVALLSDVSLLVYIYSIISTCIQLGFSVSHNNLLVNESLTHLKTSFDIHLFFYYFLTFELHHISQIFYVLLPNNPFLSLLIT